MGTSNPLQAVATANKQKQRAMREEASPGALWICKEGGEGCELPSVTGI